MLFNSYIFIFLFLPITLVGFFSLTRFRFIQASVIWLTIASFVFYSYWNFFPPEGQTPTPHYFILIVLSVVMNHQIGQWITECKLKSKKAKTLLLIGTSLNLLLIGYYKYANFFLSSLQGLTGITLSLGQIVLPLGISFYTFTQIAYLVDAYRGETKNKSYDLLTYSLFVTFFPQLIAGPILRHDELIPQFYNLRNFIFNHKNFALGLATFIIGLSKKVLIADTISPWVALAFNNAESLNFTEAWVGALSYTLQLYFDFSGYSDMAIGLGLMFNIKLPINFDSPYKATSISDFWRRWHITLSNFLRDYLYIPLGGSRQGEFRRYLNLLITMLLGGLWHGAGWTYVIWGGLHGLFLSIHHAWRKLKMPLPKFLAWLITFLAVLLSWVLFRASRFSEAFDIIKTMLGMEGIILPVGNPNGKLSVLTALGINLKTWTEFPYLPTLFNQKSIAIFGLMLLTLCTLTLPNSQQIVTKLKPTWWWAIGIGLMASFSLLSLNKVSEFLYFQF